MEARSASSDLLERALRRDELLEIATGYVGLYEIGAKVKVSARAAVARGLLEMQTIPAFEQKGHVRSAVVARKHETVGRQRVECNALAIFLVD
jgi:hypothetical protein